jgi:hypothetical protein
MIMLPAANVILFSSTWCVKKTDVHYLLSQLAVWTNKNDFVRSCFQSSWDDYPIHLLQFRVFFRWPYASSSRQIKTYRERRRQHNTFSGQTTKSKVGRCAGSSRSSPAIATMASMDSIGVEGRKTTASHFFNKGIEIPASTPPGCTQHGLKHSST